MSSSMMSYPMPTILSQFRRQTPAVARKRDAGNAVASSEHWNFCHKTLQKVSKSFSGVTLQLSQPQLRDAVCVLYLTLRAVDTVEDDMEIPAEIKIPILKNFHRHIYDKDWRFICGTNGDREIMEGHHYLHTAFMELEPSSQEIIAETLLKTGEGMAEFVPREDPFKSTLSEPELSYYLLDAIKAISGGACLAVALTRALEKVPCEIETMSDYEEYTVLTNAPWISGTSSLFQSLLGENFPSLPLLHQAALLQQKSHNIHSYYEDLTADIPNRKVFCAKEIWSKYVDRLEDFLCEDNSIKAVQFVNEMVRDALRHVEDSLEFSSRYIQDPFVFQFDALPRLLSIASLASCYNNIQVFRKDMRVSPGARAKLLKQTRSMADVYSAFNDILYIMELKVDNNDPHAAETLGRLKTIKQKCLESGTLTQRNSPIFKSIQDII